MQDFVKYKEEPDQLDLIRHFTCGIPDSYATFKKNSGLDAAFINCKLKSKSKTKAERRCEEIREEEKEAARERRRLRQQKKEATAEVKLQRNFYYRQDKNVNMNISKIVGTPGP